MRRVVWSAEAVANLDHIASYISEFSITAAARLAGRLKAAGDSLAEHSDRGRVVGRRVRELTIIYPYIIRYRVDEDAVYIIRIRHGARRPD